jgi:hypothetical protein
MGKKRKHEKDINMVTKDKASEERIRVHTCLQEVEVRTVQWDQQGASGYAGLVLRWVDK